MSDLFPDAIAADGAAPRPQLVRSHWHELNGLWDAAIIDHSDSASPPRRTSDFDPPEFDTTIIVPFPPESEASGRAHREPIAVVWYRRTVTVDDVAASGFQGDDDRLVLHFGAVDDSADIWINGQYRGGHAGGQTPFAFDVTDVAPVAPFEVVVRAIDVPTAVDLPRGKQDWRPEPHQIWYERTSGIWQPVWLEAVPRTALRSLRWITVPDRQRVELIADIDGAVPGTSIEVCLRIEQEVLARVTVAASECTTVIIDIPALRNGVDRDRLLWSPHRPTLLSADIRVSAPGSRPDSVGSYLGIRSVGVDNGRFLLNERPFFLRAVLSQGYWPSSHLAPPSVHALRTEVESIKRAGFTAVRLHQKVEDPRLLYWTDRLGLAVWAETANAFAFSTRAVERLMAEWSARVIRDASHPSIVTWVPMNESWGVEDIASDPRHQHFVHALVAVTGALDGTRPVVGNDGWEAIGADLIGVHDYRDENALARDWRDRDAVETSLQGFGPAGRRCVVGSTTSTESAAPVVLSEFGGIWWSSDATTSWGYGDRPHDLDDYERRLRSVVTAARAWTAFAGLCYTQWADTAQEANGLVTADRVPKLPWTTLWEIFRG